MPNLSQLKRERMLAFLQKIKDEHRDDDDMLPSITFIGVSCGTRIISFISTTQNLPLIWLISLGCR